MRTIRFGAIMRVLSALMFIIAIAICLCIPISFIFETQMQNAFISSAMLCVLMSILFKLGAINKDKTVNKREGYLIVALAWLALWGSCALPFLFSGTITSLTDVFFETISGLTTTGATILTDIESMPKDILFWRSFIQWLGGMGIIVLTVALLPLLGIGGIELFVAEAPGPTSEKLHPRIKDTAKALWFIYLGLTVLLFVLLMLTGMNWYDSINHALTTLATGGFSTKNNSMAYYGADVQYLITIFMFLAGVNYSLHYLTLKGKWKKVIQSDELKVYFMMVVVLTAIITFQVYRVSDITLEQAFRDSIFQIVSVITTTGFITADYTSWTEGLTVVFFIMLFIGACAGSTAGGIKLIRHIVFFKNSILEFKRILHPRGMIRLKMNKRVVPPRVLTHILVFLLLYIGTFVFGTILVVSVGEDLLTAAGAVATSISNVGPGIGKVGPVDNFSELTGASKWILSVLMLVGRLELFTIYVILTPYFWRNH